MVIEFNNELKTGVFKIDLQHKELFDKTNQLYNACIAGKGKEEIGKIMKYLAKYVNTHFETEEEYMAKYLYKNINRHRAAHNSFKKAYQNLASEFEKNGPSSGFIINVNKTLLNWFLDHIRSEDMQLALFLNTKIND